MPNWVTNTMLINKADANRILNTDNDVDFGILIPMADSLNIDTGSMDEEDIYFYLSNKRNTAHDAVCKIPEIKALIGKSPEILERAMKRAMDISRENSDKAYHHGRTLVENYRNYGCTSWYDWRNKYWGCKWNASDSKIIDETDTTMTICFDTPWCYPDVWINCLIKNNIHFKLIWVEEDSWIGAVINDNTRNADKIENIYTHQWTDDDDESETDETSENNTSELIMIDGDTATLISDFAEINNIDMTKLN